MENIVFRKESKFVLNRVIKFIFLTWVKNTNFFTKLS